MAQPAVIFLDAVGTLFGVRDSVGHIYGNLARQVGVETDIEALDKAFYRCFKAAPKMAFPDAPVTDIPHLEYLWWKQVATDTFERVSALSAFTDFDGFFSDVYQHFTTAAPWVVYTDTVASLQRWQQLGIPLGVISNFDSRLYTVLETLELKSYFDSVTISTEVGAAKPDSRIFTAALQKHGHRAADAWHIGDSQVEDFDGAKAAGIKPILIQRQGRL
ncbi:MAG: HAD-IA family hydrolase [Cyanobacteria bacterium P01_A01_bin.105]